MSARHLRVRPDHEPADPPRRARRPSGGRAGRAAERPAARPLRHRDRQRAHARGGALAEPAAVRPAGRPPGDTTASAPGSTSAPRGGWSRGRSARPGPGAEHDPWRPEQAVWPLLRVIDECRGEPGPAAVVYLGDRGPGPDADRSAAVGAGRPPGTWPSCSPRTPPAGRPWSTPGPRTATSTPPGGRCARTGPGRPSCGAGSRPSVDRPDPAERVAPRPRAAARRPEPHATCPPGCRCSAPPGSTPTTWRCSPPWPRTATSTSGCPHPSPALWTGRRTWPATDPADSRPPRADDRTEDLVRAPAAGLPRPGRPRAAADARAAAGHPSTTHHRARRRVAADHPARRLQADIAADRRAPRRRPRARCSTRTTAASCCTPPTGRTARSRCCGRCWSACWPTTRP